MNYRNQKKQQTGSVRQIETPFHYPDPFDTQTQSIANWPGWSSLPHSPLKANQLPLLPMWKVITETTDNHSVTSYTPPSMMTQALSASTWVATSFKEYVLLILTGSVEVDVVKSEEEGGGYWWRLRLLFLLQPQDFFYSLFGLGGQSWLLPYVV